MELENLRAKKTTEQRLRERQLELEQEREELELRQRKEQQERELRLTLQQQEDQLRLRQHERELENERKKGDADKEQRRMEIELTKRSSGASGSQVDDLESVGSKRNLERTAGWANSVAQHSGPSQPLSPNVVINSPKNCTQDRGDKRFSAYPKTTPLYQPGAGLFSAQLQDASIFTKPEIPKSIRVTEPEKFLPKTAFQQKGPSAFHNRQRSQSPKHSSRNRLVESQNQTTVSQATSQIIHQPSGDPRGLPKLKLTEFSGDLLEWPE